MINRLICLLFFYSLSAGAAGEVYKCSGHGEIILSDKPCSEDMKSEIIKLPLIIEKEPQQFDDQAYYKRMVTERRLREIDFEIGEKQNTIIRNIEKMNQEISELQKESDQLGQNKLNALWQQNIGLRMHAISSKYHTENTALNERVLSLQKERSTLAQ